MLIKKKTEVAIRRYLKILIKNNNGDFQTKEYIIQVLTQRLRDKIRKCYSGDVLDVIVMLRCHVTCAQIELRQNC